MNILVSVERVTRAGKVIDVVGEHLTSSQMRVAVKKFPWANDAIKAVAWATNEELTPQSLVLGDGVRLTFHKVEKV